MNKKRVRTIALLPILAMLAACGSKGDAQTGSGGSGASGNADSNTVKNKEPVTLVFYDGAGDWQEERFIKVIGEPLQQKFPHITPKFVPYTNVGKVPQMIAAGEAPDIIFNSSGLAFDRVIVHDLQTDITPLVVSSKLDLGKFDQTALDLTKQLGDGKIYGLPAFMAPAAVYYNKDIFDKFAVPYPDGPVTWDDMYELTKKLTRKDGDIQYYGMYMSLGHLAFRNQLTMPLIDPKAEKSVVQTDRWKVFMENYVRYYQVPGYDLSANGLNVTTMKNRFFKEKTVAMWIPVSGQPALSDFGNMNWDIAPFPVYKESPGVGPQPYPVIFFPTSTSKHKDTAFEAISYLASESYQLPRIRKGDFFTALNVPELLRSFGQDEPAYKGKRTQAFLPERYAPAAPQTRYDSTARSQLETAFNNVVMGKKDINTALREASEAIDKKIAELKAK